MTTRQRLALVVALSGGLLAAALVARCGLAQDPVVGDTEVAAPNSAQVSVSPSIERRPEVPVLPALPASSSGDRSTDAPGQPTTKDYIVGDVRVRDHRPGDPKPLDLPPNVHPPHARKLPSTLTADLGQQMRKVVRQCAKDIPVEARGAKPRFEAQVTTAIDNHKLTIVEIASQLRDVEGNAVDAVRDCVERNAAGLTVGAEGQDDIANYGLRFAFVIP